MAAKPCQKAHLTLKLRAKTAKKINETDAEMRYVVTTTLAEVFLALSVVDDALAAFLQAQLKAYAPVERKQIGFKYPVAHEDD